MNSREFFEQFRSLTKMGLETFRIRNGNSYFKCNKVFGMSVSGAAEVILYRDLSQESGFVVGCYESSTQISLRVVEECKPEDLVVTAISSCDDMIVVDVIDRCE